jgi:non-ribosomal peptide synthetase component F
MTLLAAFQIVLGRQTGQEDVVVGTDVANRNRFETEGLIGFFVNQLALRTDLSGNPSFRALLRRVRQTVLDAYEHQDLPFEKIVAEVAPVRHADRSSLFQVKLVLQNASREQIELPGLTVNQFSSDNGTSKFDILLNVDEEGDSLVCSNQYDSDLFDASTMRSLMCFYHAALSIIALEEPLRDAPKNDLFREINQQARRSLVEKPRRPRSARRTGVDLSAGQEMEQPA